MVDDDDLNLVAMDVLDVTSGDEEEVKGGQPRASAPRPVVDDISSSFVLASVDWFQIVACG